MENMDVHTYGIRKSINEKNEPQEVNPFLRESINRADIESIVAPEKKV